MIGDSLGVGTVPYLRQLLGGQVDANVRVGRSSTDGVAALQRRRGHYDRIVLDLGTNDGSAGQLAQSLRAARRHAGSTPIVAATLRGPGAAGKNAVLRRAGVQLVDWAGKSGGLVGGDGIHATPAGYAARARLVARALHGAAPQASSSARTRAPAGAAPTGQVDVSALLQRPVRPSMGLATPGFAASGMAPQVALPAFSQALRRRGLG